MAESEGGVKPDNPKKAERPVYVGMTKDRGQKTTEKLSDLFEKKLDIISVARTSYLRDFFPTPSRGKRH